MAKARNKNNRSKLLLTSASQKHRQHGAVAIVVAVTLTGMMAMMGMALDTGNILSERDKLQNIANAAALSAAKSYFFPNELYNKPEDNARKTIEAMGIETGELDLNLTSTAQDPKDINGRYSATVSKTVSPVLLGMVGIGETTITATASAGLAPEAAYSVDPIMACTGNLGVPGSADKTEPKIYQFMESFLDDTSLNNVIGFRMFIDTTGFDEQILNIPRLYEIASVMLGSNEKVLIYEDTPTRIVDEHGIDLYSLRPGTLLNTRFGIRNFSQDNAKAKEAFPADINSNYATRDGKSVCTNCGIRERFRSRYRPNANSNGLITGFGTGRDSIAPQDYPYLYSDYLDTVASGDTCSPPDCKADRRILKMPIAPSCGVNDLAKKQFACFFILEPTLVFLDDVLEDDRWWTFNLEFRTEFIAQHIPCPTSTHEDKVTGAYDVVLFDGATP